MSKNEILIASVLLFIFFLKELKSDIIEYKEKGYDLNDRSWYTGRFATLSLIVSSIVLLLIYFDIL